MRMLMAVILMVVVFGDFCYSQAVEDEAGEVEVASRLGFVKTISFYLKDGRLVAGKLISEQKDQYFVEHVEGSKILADKYAKRDIDYKSIYEKNVLEVLYLQETAEYFESRIWDFRDDPDDFAQAIRLYEDAKELWAQSKGQDHEKVGEIGEKVERLRGEREVWVKEIEERAKLKRLEFEATFDDRLAELDEKLDSLSEQVGEDFDKVGGRLNEVARSGQENYSQLTASVDQMGVDLGGRLDELGYDVEANEREIDRLWRRFRYYPRYYYKPSPKVDEQP